MADQKLTALTALASLSADDLFYVVDDPGGAATSHKLATSVLDARFASAAQGALAATALQIANNLSDVASVATARTNLGLAAGGAGDIWVEKAGDTMTGLLTYAEPAGASHTFYSVNPVDANARSFNWNIGTSDNPGSLRDNVIINWGYNNAIGGGAEDDTDPSFYQQIETFYQPAGTSQFEYHWDFFLSGGADPGIRPMHLNMHHASGEVDLYWTSDATVWISAADTNLVLARLNGAATLALSEWIHYTPVSVRMDGSAFSVRNTDNMPVFSISAEAGITRGAIDSKSELAFSSTIIAGLRLNNLTTVQKNALTGANGMLLYDTTLGRMQGYIAGAWATLYSAGGTDVAIADGGTGQSTAQLGINALTNVAAATDEWVLTKDTATGNAIFKAAAGGSSLPVADTQTLVMGSADNTKLLRFEVDGFTAGATRVMTPPNQDTTLAGQNFANVFTVAQTIDLAANSKPLVIQEAAGQTAGNAVLEWQKSDGTVLGMFQSLTQIGGDTVRLFLPSTGDTFSRFGITDSTFTNFYYFFDGAGRMQWGDGTTPGGLIVLGQEASGTLALFRNPAADQTLPVFRIRSYDTTTGALIQLTNVSLSPDARLLRLMAHASQAVPLVQWEDSSANVIGTINTSDITISPLNAVTNAISNVLNLRHNSSGTPAAGFGTGLIFGGESSTTNDQDMGRLTYEWATATHASRKALSKWTVFDTAEREGIRIEADGAAAMLAFYGGINAVAKQTITGSRGGNAALADLLTKLATLGLFIDGSSA